MVTPSFQIGDRLIGEGQPVYVIAEAGVNHNGSVELAHDLISVAAKAGADAIKFQTFDPNSLVVAGADTAEYQRQHTGMTDQQKMLSQLVLPSEAWPKLQSTAKEMGIDFLSTPFDHVSLELLVTMGVGAIKLSSGDLTNHGLLRAARATGLPIILSTGASYLGEVQDAVEALGGHHDLALLHCVTSYPSPIGQSNLRAIRTLRDTIGCVSGWSDHSVGSTTAIIAVALGARIIEKHITLDTTMLGPDHPSSADPEMFCQYLRDIRSAEQALGDGTKEPQAADLENRSLARRGWYATRDIRAGAVVSAGDFVALRPEMGVSASMELAGMVASRLIQSGDPVQTGDLVKQE